ncbi:zip homologous protein 2-like [Anopheles maculipalpis]|uniref:zip homologous protein 2-like n=1 Tax=Anopheles maculipalpis TaxID=1496333 RepID=UPI0021593D4B|nr:zip homologous protein 2-like [Anopheles maculipalpis]
MLVFCERCHEQRTTGELEFYITTCGHMFCRKCSSISTKCPICAKPCRTTIINKDMPLNVKELFENQTKQANQLGKIGKIYQFQISKMDHFIEANWTVFKEYETRKQRIQKLKEMYEAYKKGIVDEQNLIIQLQQKQKEAIQKGRATEFEDNSKEDFFQNTTPKRF